MEQMLLTQQGDGTTLASKFKVLLLDNASIHHDTDFVFKLRQHIKVRFIPPYCYHLSALDNGAYGLVVHFLKQNSHMYGDRPIEVGLRAAFASVGSGAAAWCFHKCGYKFF